MALLIRDWLDARTKSKNACAWLYLFAITIPSLAQTRPVASLVQISPLNLDENALVESARKYPRDGGVWFNLGVVRAQRGEVATAIFAFKRSVTLLSDKLASYRNIIALDLRSHDTVAALSTCHDALALYPADDEVLQNCAYAFSKELKFAEALAPLQSLKRARPKDVAVRVALISALRGAHRITESDAELRELLNGSLLSLGQAQALAQDLSKAKAEDEARETAKYIAKTWPSKAGSEASAIAAETSSASPSVIAGPPQQLSAAIKQATALIQAERYLDAMHFLDQAREQFPNQAALEYDAALADVCLQRYPEAVTILKSIQHQGPRSARVDFLLGGSYEIEGDEENAESSYREATQIEPNNFTYYRVLAALLQKEGRFADSSIELRRALSFAPDDSQTLILLARTLEREGEIDRAIYELEHAICSDPNSRRAHSLLATLYFRQKRTPDAEHEQAIAAKLEDQRIQRWTIWGTALPESN